MEILNVKMLCGSVGGSILVGLVLYAVLTNTNMMLNKDIKVTISVIVAIISFSVAMVQNNLCTETFADTGSEDMDALLNSVLGNASMPMFDSEGNVIVDSSFTVPAADVDIVAPGLATDTPPTNILAQLGLGEETANAIETFASLSPLENVSNFPKSRCYNSGPVDISQENRENTIEHMAEVVINRDTIIGSQPIVADATPQHIYPCRKLQSGKVVINQPMHYLLNDKPNTNNGLSLSELPELMKKSKLFDLYNQHAHSPVPEFEKMAYFGRARLPLTFDHMYEFTEPNTGV